MSVHQPVPPPRSVSRASQRSAHSSRTMSTNVRRLHEALGSILTETERGFFVKALNDYHSRRNIQQLVQNLAPILDTAEKRQLYVLLRKVIPSTDQALFWQCAQQSQNGKQRAGRSFQQEHGPRHPTETFPTRTQIYAPERQANHSNTFDQRITSNRRTPEPFSKTVKVTSGYQQTPSEQRQDVHKVVLQKDRGLSLGFSIRGGVEHSVGIFVTQVEQGGYAESQGLLAGDQIVACNEIPFEDMSHAEAAMVLKTARSLVLYVQSVGRVPGSFQSHQTYTWVDPQGRSVSPPPDVDPMRQVHLQNGRKSNATLLKNGNEKMVTLVVEDGESLGLMIRGGREFGLGIYITGVDPYSVAEHCGLKVGDQIINVNRRTFLSIEHQEAVAILKSSKEMTMTIRDVKKLPYARTTVDRTQWLTGDDVWKGQDVTQRKQDHPRDPDEEDSDEENESLDEKPLFSRGIAGSQMMYSSMMKTQGWSMIEEQARYFLNENEKGTMMFYLKEYQNKHINVDSLVSGLFEILNTHSKFSLLSEIRSFINARDIDRYDTLVMKKEVEAMKQHIFERSLTQARQKGLLDIEKDLFFGETISNDSHPSSASGDSRPITPPFVPEEPPPNLALNFTSSPSEHDMQHSSNEFPPRLSADNSILNQFNLQTVTVDVHHHGGPSKASLSSSDSRGRTFAGSSLYADSKSPSEDSGVDMALGIGSARSGISSSVSPRINTSLVRPQPTLSSLSPKSPCMQGKQEGNKLQRRLSLDSVSTEGSTPTSPLESMQRLSIGSDQSIPRRISDPTHHVPRDQKKSVSHTKKASEQLYQLMRKSDDLVSSPKSSSSKYLERLSSSNLEDGDDDYDLGKSPNLNGSMEDNEEEEEEEEPKTIFDSIKMKNRKLLLADLHHMPVDENGNGRKSLGNRITAKPRRSRGGAGREQDATTDFNQSLTSLRSSRSTSPASNESFTTRLLQQTPSSTESRKSWEFVDVNINPPVRSFVIEMKKSRPNLGIAVEGGAGTRQPLPKIIKIQPGGSADTSSSLMVGHVIISVNGRDLRGLNHQQATRIIAEEFKNKKVQSLAFLVVDSNKYKLLY